MTETPAADIVQRLRTTRLLSQRNQMALQCEAATEIEALRAEHIALDAEQLLGAWSSLQRKLDEAVKALESIAFATDIECDFDSFDMRREAKSALASIRGETDQ